MLSLLSSAPRRAMTYLREVRSEIHKIAWPTQRNVMIYTAFVFGTCVALAVYSGIVDFGLTELVNFIITR